MAAKKALRVVNGTITEFAGVVTSAGAANDGDFPVLDAGGKLDVTLMPTGIGADTAAITTSEALSAGNQVNIFDAGGSVFRVRKADAATGKPANGFVLAAFASGAVATIYFEGTNNQLSGLAPGVLYLSTTVPGGVQSTPPTVAGEILQRVGFAVSATTQNFQAGEPITRA